MEPPPPADWLSSGGAFWVVGLSWAMIAAVFYGISNRLGQAARAENDGCIMGIMNILLTLVGGAAGLLLFRDRYPIFLASSMFGALTLPTVGTLLIIYRMSRSGPRRRT